jgi:hypothetical protein
MMIASCLANLGLELVLIHFIIIITPLKVLVNT